MGFRDVVEYSVLRKDPLEYLRNSNKKYGARQTLSLPFNRIHLLHTPEAASHALLTKRQKYGKCAKVFDKIQPLTGKTGIVQLEGPEWKKLRAEYSKMFSDNSLSFLKTDIDTLARESVAKFNDGEEIDLLVSITEFVLSNALRIFAGVSLSACKDMADTFLELNTLCGERMLSPLALPSFKVHRLRKKLNQQVDTLLDKSPLYFEGLSKEVLRDQIKTFLFAGHETTCSSIVSAIHLMASHQNYQDLYHTLPEEEKEPFLECVYKEALRLYSPAWMLVRTAVEDDPEMQIKKKDHIFISVHQIHRDPRYWEDADTFKPLRHKEALAHRAQFIPYGLGPKVCIGQKLAPVEAVAIMKELLNHFRITNRSELKMTAHITLFPEGPIPLHLKAIP